MEVSSIRKSWKTSSSITWVLVFWKGRCQITCFLRNHATFVLFLSTACCSCWVSISTCIIPIWFRSVQSLGIIIHPCHAFAIPDLFTFCSRLDATRSSGCGWGLTSHIPHLFPSSVGTQKSCLFKYRHWDYSSPVHHSTIHGLSTGCTFVVSWGAQWLTELGRGAMVKAEADGDGKILIKLYCCFCFGGWRFVQFWGGCSCWNFGCHELLR